MNIETIVVGFLNTNCYIVHDGELAVVIDPGANAERIMEKAQSLGVRITHILLTHAHFDHVLAVPEIVAKTGAKLVANVLERRRMTDAELSGQTMLRRREFIPIHADIEIDEEGSLDVGKMHFDFLRTPGHTEGSMCIICDDVMFTGDTLFAGTCGRCDLAGGDYKAMLTSLKKLYLIENDYRVLPGHESATTLSEEKSGNPYMAEAVRN